MTGPPHQPEVDDVLDRIRGWAAAADVGAVVLVGSYARGTATADSDVDLVLVLDDLPGRLTDDAWIPALLPGAVEVRRRRWGVVHERRMMQRSGLVVELGLTDPGWLRLPLDPGTAAVLADGARVVWDRSGDAAAAVRAARPRPT